MKAAVLEGFHQPLQIQEVADPVPGAEEVLVRTRSAGICRTDLKIIDGGVPTVTPPLIPGHELAGELVTTGPGLELEEGARVTVSLDISCGLCEYCRIGELDYCSRLRRLGLEEDGALAELVRVPATNVVPIPPSISFAEAATIPDAVGSPYHAVVYRAGVRPAQTVAVYGLGGLGLTAVQVAGLLGARVIAIARTPERRALAEELGATWSVDPREGKIPDQIRDLTDGVGVHAFFDLVGIEGSVDDAVLSCRKGGRVVVLGYSIPQLSASMMRLVLHEISIVGSRGSTRAHLLEAIDLVGRGKIRPVIGELLELGDVNRGLDQLREGSIIGRAVVQFA